MKVRKAQEVRSWMKCQITRRRMGWSLGSNRISHNGGLLDTHPDSLFTLLTDSTEEKKQ